MGWGKRLAPSALLAMGVSIFTWFGIGYGISAGIYSAAQQMAASGAMFFLVFGIGMAKDSADQVTK